jgi:hypothetical protein
MELTQAGDDESCFFDPLANRAPTAAGLQACEFLRTDPPIMNRRANKDRASPRVAELVDLFDSRDPASQADHDRRVVRLNLREQPARPCSSARPHAGEVEDQKAVHPAVDRDSSQFERLFRSPTRGRGDSWLALKQIEAENDVVTADPFDDISQSVWSVHRLQSDNDLK